MQHGKCDPVTAMTGSLSIPGQDASQILERAPTAERPWKPGAAR